MDATGRQVFGKRLTNCLDTILMTLSVYKGDLIGVVVESTFNWYWLVDGLMDNGYQVHLANPAAIKQYEGLKHTDDQRDAYWLAQMLRLGILPEGYIYPKEDRPVRDLLRRRMLFVRQRTALMLSFQSMVSRNLNQTISATEIKKLQCADAATLFNHEYLQLAGAYMIYLVQCQLEATGQIEHDVLSQVRLRPEFQSLLTLPGVGKILGITIMLEVGDIHRFPTVGDYSSYCRCVKTDRLSNGKSKGKGNKKNGNKYLAWAYVEAAHFANRTYPEVQRFYQRKRAKTNSIVATKAVCNKLARASYWMMKKQAPYDPDLLFR